MNTLLNRKVSKLSQNKHFMEFIAELVNDILSAYVMGWN